MEIVLETVEITTTTRSGGESKYADYAKALAAAPLKAGKSKVTVAELTGIRAAIKRHNEANPTTPIFIAACADGVSADGKALFRFAKIAAPVGKKRGRKAKGADTGPKVGEIYNG